MPATLPGLIARGALDPELGALLWLLVEGRVSLLVIGPGPADQRDEFLDALLRLRPPDHATSAPIAIGPDGVWSGELAAVIRSVPAAGALAATMEADSLRDALEHLAGPDAGLTEEEIRVLGLVIVLDTMARVEAVHLLRPVERDGAGHLQVRPPAVLAARDPRTGELESFAWGVLPEIADRIDREQSDFEQRQAGRARLVGELASAGPLDASTTRSRMARHLRAEGPRVPAPERPPARASWPPSANEGTHTH